MAKGTDMGQKSPFSKDYLKDLYNKVDSYCKTATLYAFNTEGKQIAMETMAAYIMF